MRIIDSIENAKAIGRATLVIMVTAASIAHADDFTQCSQSFYGGIYPEFTNPKLSKDTQALCMDGFAVMYSGVLRTPFWSAEHLTRERLTQAKTIDREDSFHEESRLPESMRAKVDDYSGSGFDRGHLAPNGDMATRSQQYDSFSLANIAPQSPRNNRYIWRNIESATRYLTQQYGEVYTVTGVAFTNKKLYLLDREKDPSTGKFKPEKERVRIPNYFFKAVYIPAINQAGVYYAPNDESERIDIISINALSAKTGIDVLPMLDSQTKTQSFELPLKAGAAQDEAKTEAEAPIEPFDWMLLVLAILKWLMEKLTA